MSIEEYFRDFEQLALKSSLAKVLKAVESLRLLPDQKFFPKPDEVAAEIERQSQSNIYVLAQRDYEAQQRCLHAEMDEDFRKYGNWQERWRESGLKLADFCKRDDEDRAQGRGFYAGRQE